MMLYFITHDTREASELAPVTSELIMVLAVYSRCLELLP